jgi:hypothetical protein
MIRKTILFASFLVVVIGAVSCNKNYYSGSGRGSKCGCPSEKGMISY